MMADAFVFLWYVTCTLLIVSGIALVDWLIERVPILRRGMDRFVRMMCNDYQN